MPGAWGPVLSALEEVGVSGLEALGLDAAGAALTGLAGLQAGVDVPNDAAAVAVDIAAVAKDAEAAAKFVKLAKALAESPVGELIAKRLATALPAAERALAESPEAFKAFVESPAGREMFAEIRSGVRGTLEHVLETGREKVAGEMGGVVKTFLESPFGKKIVEATQGGVADSIKNAITYGPGVVVAAVGGFVATHGGEMLHPLEYSEAGKDHYQKMTGKELTGTVSDVNREDRSFSIDTGRGGKFMIRHVDETTMASVALGDGKKMHISGSSHDHLTADLVPAHAPPAQNLSPSRH